MIFDGLMGTLIGALILMSLVAISFLIGWFLTSKFRMQKRGCGMAPSKNGKSSCKICSPEKNCKDEEK